MTDITTRDEEHAREIEIAEEKGRIKQQEEQKERERSLEKGRKIGHEEERERQKKGGLGTGATVVIALIVVVLIVALVAFLTLSASVTNVTPGNTLPYSTSYSVSFPEGQMISIANTHISVLSYQNELITDIDGDRQKLLNGQSRSIGERRAVISTLGSLTLVDTIFRIDLVYKGDRDNQAYFDLTVYTSKQIPDILIQKLLPREIDARPI